MMAVLVTDTIGAIVILALSAAGLVWWRTAP